MSNIEINDIERQDSGLDRPNLEGLTSDWEWDDLPKIKEELIKQVTPMNDRVLILEKDYQGDRLVKIIKVNYDPAKGNISQYQFQGYCVSQGNEVRGSYTDSILVWGYFYGWREIIQIGDKVYAYWLVKENRILLRSDDWVVFGMGGHRKIIDNWKK